MKKDTNAPEDINKVNWDKVKSGDWFSAIISGLPVLGKINKEDGEIFFCQNYLKGEETSNTYGFDKSWVQDSEVKDLRIWTSKPNSKQIGFSDKSYVVLNDELTALPVKGGVLVNGNRKVSNTDVEKVYNLLNKGKHLDIPVNSWCEHSSYTRKGALEIGCQTIPNKAVEKLYNSLVK